MDLFDYTLLIKNIMKETMIDVFSKKIVKCVLLFSLVSRRMAFFEIRIL